MVLVSFSFRGINVELHFKVEVSIGWLHYSWICFCEFFKESSDHSMLIVFTAGGCEEPSAT